MLFADVILPLSLSDYYTYKIPDNLSGKCMIGQRVLVQFGKKKFYTAIIRNIHSVVPQYETKNVYSIVDQFPIINAIQLTFWEWIANYYMTPIGEVYSAAVPISLRIESQTQIALVKEIIDEEVLSDNDKILINKLKTQKTLTISSISKLLEINNPIKIINNLLDKGIIDIYQHLKKSYKPKYERFVKLSRHIRNEKDLELAFNKVKRAKKQTSALMAYCSVSKLKYSNETALFSALEVSKKEIIQKSDCNSAVLKSLFEKNILTEYEKIKSRLAVVSEGTVSFNKLNNEQEAALNQIQENFETSDVTLLHGITASGKTEVYIHLIRKYIKKGKQVLYLLPEIALTTQIIERLQAAFGNIVGVYHSKFNDSERVEIWNKISINSNDKDKYQIILGVRSTIFLPFSDLGLIIIDEEHETTYKQFDPSPRYNARDSAIVLAKLFSAKVLLGTATPSLETYFNVKNGKYKLVELRNRHSNIELPEIILADLKAARKQKRMNSIFHPLLIEAIRETLDNNEQVILFQNRRGFSPYIECKSCGWIPKCQNCDVSLTYHIYTNDLVCHYCGYSQKIPSFCDNCNNISLETVGFGTQKVEDEIKIFFPDANVARLDLDISKRKNAYSRVLHSFTNGETNILVGTQMITKGLDFENVNVVGVLNADSLLNYPDFRSPERAFQLITQVSGRAGRAKHKGKVIIQTTNPKNIVLKLIVNNAYNSLYHKEIAERKTYKYPPFYRLIKIAIKHKKSDVVDVFSQQLADLLKSIFLDRVLGPKAPLIARIQNYYIKEILIKLEPKISLQKAKKSIIEQALFLKQQNNFSTVKINFNPDPM